VGGKSTLWLAESLLLDLPGTFQEGTQQTLHLLMLFRTISKIRWLIMQYVFIGEEVVTAITSYLLSFQSLFLPSPL
jgi:hypothetical protein